MEVDTFCTAQSQVQLGAYCGDPGSRNFVYFDMFVECGDGSEWDNINGNYTCTETAMVNSFATVSETIPKVEIYTDYRWSLLTSDICHTYKKNERMTNSGNGVKKVYDGAKEIFGSDRRVTELKVGDFEGSDSGSVSIARSVWSAIVLAFLVGSMVVFV